MDKTGRKSWLRRIAAAAAIAAMVLFAVPQTVQMTAAEDNTYTTPSFDVNITANENNSFRVVENIDVDFIYPHHGIYRYIPTNGIKISNIKVPGYDCEVSTQNGYKVLQIGSASYTLYGPVSYQIGYTMSFYDDEDTSLDRLMLNVIPTGWETEIGHASATITLPKPADLSKVQVYSGSYGTTGNEDNATVRTSEDGMMIRVDAYNVQYNHGITVILELPEGYWEGEAEYGALPPFMFLLFLLGPVGAFLLWFLYGRDDEMVRTLEFYPPDELTPGEVGYIIDGSADRRDLVSTIVYLADKGYIAIDQDNRKDFTLIALEPPGADEPQYVRTIFNGLFAKKDEVRTSQLGVSFGRKYETAREQLIKMFSKGGGLYRPASMLARVVGVMASAMPSVACGIWQVWCGEDFGIFTAVWGGVYVIFATIIICMAIDGAHSASRRKTALMICIGMLLTLVSLIPAIAITAIMLSFSNMRALMVILAVIVGTLLSMFLAVISLARKTEYAAIMGRILGFKDFIRTAELDQLNALIEEDPEYFYHIIPYAYVFGLTNRWIKKFENIPVVQPGWIRTEYGGIDRFDAYMMGRMMSDCSASVSNNIHLPQASGSSGGSSSGGSSWSGGGFSGGGFSGGGGGGGGGGAW